MLLKVWLMTCCLYLNAIEVMVTKGTVKPIIFSIPNIECSNRSDKSLSIGEEIQRTIINALTNSGMFLSHQAEQTAWQIFNQYNLETMRRREIKIYTACYIEKLDTHIHLKLRILHDTGQKPEIIDAHLKAPIKSIKLLAHQIANLIYKTAWSIPGDFDSQLLYVDKTAGNNRLILSERDGATPTTLDSSPIIATPAVSKDGEKIAYVKHIKHYACIFLYDRKTKRISKLTPDNMICTSPAFSNDGTYLVFSGSVDGSTSLYKLYLNQKNKLLKITQAEGWIDTAPAFTASGNEIVIVSDRADGLRPKPYLLNLESGKIDKLKSSSGSYHDPDCCINPFNPSLTQVAFFKRLHGMAYLGMFILDKEFKTMQEKLLWQGTRIYSPSWGLNGTSITFNTLNYIKRLNIFTGTTENINTIGNPNTPAVIARPSWEQTVQITLQQ